MRTNNNKVAFLDLHSLHKELKSELFAVFETALETSGFIGGPMVLEFEREFARYCEAKHCVGVGSGTDALRFALMATGVRPGDIVLTVPLTFIATTEAISQAGARPEFIDIDPRTYTIDPEKLRDYLEMNCGFDKKSGHTIHRFLGRRVAAVIPVHLYGQSADMDPILELAERYNLIVIEDACQAHGAQYFSRKMDRWCRAGSMGHAAAFSFYPGKNLGALGEAGAVTTDNEEVALRIRMLRDHGQKQKYHHEIEGYNGRLDSIQAGVLLAKLPHLSCWNEQRRACARRYAELLAGVEEVLTLPFEPSWSRSVYHLYVVRVADRDFLQRDLEEDGISTGIHYPVPLHLAKAYETLGYRQGDLPESERVAASLLSLPMYPQLAPEHQDRVANAVLQSLAIKERVRFA